MDDIDSAAESERNDFTPTHYTVVIYSLVDRFRQWVDADAFSMYTDKAPGGASEGYVLDVVFGDVLHCFMHIRSISLLSKTTLTYS